MDSNKKEEEREPFYVGNANENTNETVGRIFVGIGLMMLAFGMSALLIWSYFRSANFFIAILSSIVFVYAVIVVIITAVRKDNFTKIIFELLLGSSAVMCLAMIILIIVFSVKAGRADNRSNSSTRSTAYGDMSSTPSNGDNYN